MDQNQKQEVFVTKITFTGVKEVEGGKVLLCSREYNTGAKDNESQSPVIKDEEFDMYIDISVKNLEDAAENLLTELKVLTEKYNTQIAHLEEQVETLKSFK